VVCYAIEKCKSQLLSITPSINNTNNLPSELNWSANNPPDENGFQLIVRGKIVSLDVVRSFQNYEAGSITLRNEGAMMVFSPGTYSIVFNIEGFINSNFMLGQRYSANIILEKGHDIRLENIKHVPQRA